MDEAVELILQFGLAALIIAAQLVGRWIKKRQAERQPPRPAPQQPPELDWPWGEDDDDPEPVAAASNPGAGAAREQLAARADDLARRSATLRDSVRRDRAAEHLGPAIAQVGERARELAGRLRREGGAPAPWDADELAELELQHHWLERFVSQRRDPRQRAALGDADALARACYRPLLQFAHANRVALSSADAVTVLGPFELSTWTGMLDAGVAPIFLPPDFFARLAWWPALAHEIGHDFLAATDGADHELRDQLGVAPEAEGRRLLDPRGGSLSGYDLHRIMGAWFEELFCDVVGTLMLGPAYGHTMVALFSRPGPRGAAEVARVHLDGTGLRYGVHPPRHLRVLWCARALELCGEEDEAEAIVAEWERLHGPIDAIAVPSTAGLVGVPVEIWRALGIDLVERLYREPLRAYDGHPLGSIPGADWGPALASEARRVRADYLAGRTTGSRDPRAVIAGAVLAWRQEPELERWLLDAARAAIVGRAEWVDGADEHRAAPPAPAEPGAGELSPAGLREAFVLHTILSPSPSVRRLRGGRAGASILDRR